MSFPTNDQIRISLEAQKEHGRILAIQDNKYSTTSHNILIISQMAEY